MSGPRLGGPREPGKAVELAEALERLALAACDGCLAAIAEGDRGRPCPSPPCPFYGWRPVSVLNPLPRIQERLRSRA